MIVRIATRQDIRHICSVLSHKNIPWSTAMQAKEDILLGQMRVLCENGKIVTILSLVYDPIYNYTAIKRLCILNKKNCGRGLAQTLLNIVSSNFVGKMGCTPWEDNVKTRKMLEKAGFTYQYNFNGHWTYYEKK